MKLIPRIGRMLKKPEKVFALVKNEKVGRSWGYFFLLLLISNVTLLIAGIITYQKFLLPIMWDFPMQGVGIITIALLLLFYSITLIIGFLVSALFITLGLNILKARIKVADSIKVLAYACTPCLLTAWILPLTIGTSIWSYFLMLKAFKTMNQVSRLKTFGVTSFYLLLVIFAGIIITIIANQLG